MKERSCPPALRANARKSLTFYRPPHLEYGRLEAVHLGDLLRIWAVGSLVVRAPDSRPEGLDSMPVPPNTLRVHTEYVLVESVAPKVLWAGSRVQGTGKKFPPLQFHA
ncbi:uncharacterized protein TNCV_827451 [Trichonephila clavipes]|nr:uncharacterized protein TNCV_827451 [Trichonephila clavipes]